jgi:hypothetical protein
VSPGSPPLSTESFPLVEWDMEGVRDLHSETHSVLSHKLNTISPKVVSSAVMLGLVSDYCLYFFIKKDFSKFAAQASQTLRMA